MLVLILNDIDKTKPLAIPPDPPIFNPSKGRGSEWFGKLIFEYTQGGWVETYNLMESDLADAILQWNGIKLARFNGVPSNLRVIAEKKPGADEFTRPVDRDYPDIAVLRDEYMLMVAKNVQYQCSKMRMR